jgi:hypothetical protein
MKTQLVKLFWFILKFFEGGDQPYLYKPLNRIILITVGVLFTILSLLTLYFSGGNGGYGFLIPVMVFFSVGFVCMVVGFLGSERAVSNIWGNR